MKIIDCQKIIFQAINEVFKTYPVEIKTYINLPQNTSFPLIKISSITKIPSLILNQEKFHLTMHVLNNTNDNLVIADIIEFIQSQMPKILDKNENFVCISEDISKIHDNFNDKIWSGEHSFIVVFRQ